MGRMRETIFERRSIHEWAWFICSEPDSTAGVGGLVCGCDPGPGILEKTSVRFPGCPDQLCGAVPAGFGDPDYHGAPWRELEPGRHCRPGGIDPGGCLGPGPGGHLWLEEIS